MRFKVGDKAIVRHKSFLTDHYGGEIVVITKIYPGHTAYYRYRGDYESTVLDSSYANFNDEDLSPPYIMAWKDRLST